MRSQTQVGIFSLPFTHILFISSFIDNATIRFFFLFVAEFIISDVVAVHLHWGQADSVYLQAY